MTMARRPLAAALFLAGVASACVPKEPEGSFADGESAPEECGNGQDDDGDGLVDCEDAECMEAFECVHAGATFQAQVLAGDLLWDRELVRADELETQRVEITDVVGTLRMITASGTTTCDWSLDRAWMTHTHGNSGTTFRDVAAQMSWQREGLAVGPDCGVDSAGFVPPLLFAYGAESGSTVSFRTSSYGAPWYFGYGQYSLDTTRYWNAGAYAEVIGWSQAVWEAELEAGASWSFTLPE